MQGCSCTDCRNDGKPQNKASRDVALIRFRQVRYTRILNPKVETLISGCNYYTCVCARVLVCARAVCVCVCVCVRERERERERESVCLSLCVCVYLCASFSLLSLLSPSLCLREWGSVCTMKA